MSSATSRPASRMATRSQRCRLVHQVRRQDHRRALSLAQVGEVLPDVAPRRRVEPGARLVEHEQLRAVQQRLGHFDAPLRARPRACRPGRACGRPAARAPAPPACARRVPGPGARRGGPGGAGSRRPSAARPAPASGTPRRGDAGRPPGARATSSPNTRTVPADAASSVETILKRVVLPPPFGPSRPKISPAPTAKLTSSSATRSPYRWRSDSTSTAGSTVVMAQAVGGSPACSPASSPTAAAGR